MATRHHLIVPRFENELIYLQWADGTNDLLT